MKNEVKHALLSNITLHSLYFPNSKINSIKKAIFNAFARILENQNFSKKNLFLSWPNLTLINISNHSISNKNYRKFNIIKMFYQRCISLVKSCIRCSIIFVGYFTLSISSSLPGIQQITSWSSVYSYRDW